MYYRHDTISLSLPMKIGMMIMSIFTILVGLAVILEISNGTDTLPIFGG